MRAWPRPSRRSARRSRRPRASKVLIVLDQFEQWLQPTPNEPPGRAGPGPAPVRRRRGSRPSCWSATTSGWPSRGSSSALEIRWSRGATPPPSSCSTPPTPARCWSSSAAPAAGSRRPRADPAPEAGAVPRPGRRRARRPRRPDHPRPAEPLRRDGAPPALDARDLADLGGVEGIGVTFLEEAFDRGRPRRPTAATASGPGGPPGLLPAPGSVAPRCSLPGPRADRHGRLRRPPRRLRRADADPRQRAAAGHPGRPRGRSPRTSGTPA